ncbi:hypothetical protein KCU62_g3542, partial [Aureobasidium sp. EXF-3399]
MFEDVWFRNTEFILPAFTLTPGSSRQSAAMSLEVHVASFLDRLCRRQRAHATPVTVEVVVDVHADLRLSQDSIRRLLLVAYHLEARKELLNIKVVVDTDSHRGKLEANELIAKPLKDRLQNACSTMQQFKDGSMNMAQVYDSVGRVHDTLGLQGFPRENVAATVLNFMYDVEQKEKAEVKEEQERAKQA